MADEPLIESITFAGGKGDVLPAVIIVAGGKRHTFRLTEERLCFGIESAVGALRRRNDRSADWPPV